MRVGERKERSDKKREVKPLVPVEAKEMIFRLSHITFKPLKDVCEFLTLAALSDRETLDKLSKHFKRSIVIDKTYYFGDMDGPTIPKRLKEKTDILSVKFKKKDYETISALAYALDCTPTRVTAILIESATRNVQAVNKFIYEYMVEELSVSQMNELRKVLSYVNRYSSENSSWLTVLSNIVGDIRPSTKKLYELVEAFLKGK